MITTSKVIELLKKGEKIKYKVNCMDEILHEIDGHKVKIATIKHLLKIDYITPGENNWWKQGEYKTGKELKKEIKKIETFK